MFNILFHLSTSECLNKSYVPIEMENEKDKDPISKSASEALVHFKDAGLKERLKPHYFKVKNIFSDEERQSILSILKGMAPINELSGKGFDVLSSTQPETLNFSPSHEMDKSQCVFSKYSSLQKIQHLYIDSINHFARVLGLTGPCGITFKVVRLHSRDGEPFNGGWHYDVKASKTLVIMLKNDFHYLNGNKGLNIAFNGLQGPHHPDGLTKRCFPENEKYHSVTYKDAIMLDNAKGEIVHSTPPLDPHSPVTNPERIFIQIKLLDTDWKPIVR